jgi:hypothetical protein
MADSKYIEKVRVYRVVNGHVIQINLVGIDTEYTFVCAEGADLSYEISEAITRVTQEKH